jgi:transcriptional regulator with XRE-family HTH domain
MDMQLNPEVLRREREIRAWSQSHLAEVAGLSMRTVQRIERTGSASQESAKALASALDTQIESLLLPVNPSLPPPSPSLWLRYLIAAASTSACVLGVLFWVSVSLAPGVIDLSIVSTSNNTKQLAQLQVLNVDGKQSEMEIAGVMKIQLTSRQMGSDVLLSAQVYEFIGNQYQLKAKPGILAVSNEISRIHIDFGSGGTFEIQVKPRNCGWWWHSCISS